MTFDVIAAARRRTRRLVLVVAGTGVLICALVYPAGLYANSHLDDNAPTPPPATRRPTGVGAVTVGGGAGAAGRHDLDDGGRRGAARVGRRPARCAATTAWPPGSPTPRPGRWWPRCTCWSAPHPQVGLGGVRTDPAPPGASASTRPRCAQPVDADYRRPPRRRSRHGRPGRVLPAAVAGVRVDAYTDARGPLSMLTVAVDADRRHPVRRHRRRRGLDRRGLGAGRPARRAVGRRGRSWSTRPRSAAIRRWRRGGDRRCVPRLTRCRCPERPRPGHHRRRRPTPLTEQPGHDPVRPQPTQLHAGIKG